MGQEQLQELTGRHMTYLKRDTHALSKSDIQKSNRHLEMAGNYNDGNILIKQSNDIQQNTMKIKSIHLSFAKVDIRKL